MTEARLTISRYRNDRAATPLGLDTVDLRPPERASYGSPSWRTPPPLRPLIPRICFTADGFGSNVSCFYLFDSY